MPLAVSRPLKHPKSGVYWLRKGVPEDLRKLVGKREEKRSLQTRDPAEAKRRCKSAPKHDPSNVMWIKDFSCQSASGPHAE